MIGTLQGRLMEIQVDQALLAHSEDALDDLVEKNQKFSISDSTRIRFNKFESYKDSASGTLLRLPYGLRNSASPSKAKHGCIKL
jgi:hypothetical protein